MLFDTTEIESTSDGKWGSGRLPECLQNGKGIFRTCAVQQPESSVLQRLRLVCHPCGDGVVHGDNTVALVTAHGKFSAGSVGERAGAVFAADFVLDGTVPHGHHRKIAVGVQPEGQPVAVPDLCGSQFRREHGVRQLLLTEERQAAAVCRIESQPAVQSHAERFAQQEMRYVFTDEMPEAVLHRLFQLLCQLVLRGAVAGECEIDTLL